MRKLLFIILSLSLLAACSSSNEKKEDVVARAYDEYLYKSDLIGLVPKGTPAKDSLATVKSFIDNWIKTKLLIHNAEENLSSDQKDFEKQMEDYRNSLILYTYEKELIRQKLDTSVNDSAIATFYESNKAEFLLKDNIVKVWYVKMPLKSANSASIKALYKTDTEANKKILEEKCNQFAANYYLDDESWLMFDDLLKEIPIKTYDQEDYLKNHRFIEMQDSLYDYFVNIKDFQVKESVSPLSFEKENIRSIILNKRKLKLIEDMQNTLFKNALKEKEFEIY
jgi:hypothetical protein